MSIFLLKQYPEKLYRKVKKDFLKYGEQYKKIAFKLIIWNILFLFKKNKTKIKSSFNDDYIHIIFNLGGGLGDSVNQAYYIEAFKKHFGEKVIIDILSEEKDFKINHFLFTQLKITNNVVKEINKNYDIFINLIRFPKIIYFDKNRISNNLLEYIEYIDKFHQNNLLLVGDEFLGAYYSQSNGFTRKTQADIGGLLNVKDIKIKLDFSIDNDVLKKFNLSSPYITLQTGGGHHLMNAENETRQWKIEYYNELCLLLKSNYPQYKIVQIGSKDQSEIKNVDINLTGQTNFTELLTILKCSKLHISQEGGLPILRSIITDEKSVVLFGPTDEKFFGIDGNINICMRKCPCSCEWLTYNWIHKCIKTGYRAECMENLLPEYVFQKIKESDILKNNEF